MNAPPDDITIPPPLIKNAIIKTVDFTERRGEDFVNRLKQKQTESDTADSRFSFLDPNDPYHRYYLWYIEEYKQGRQKEVVTGGDSGTTPQSTITTTNEIIPHKDFEFSFDMPNISAQDLDILKLTALYTAKYGKQWQTKLSHREQDNFQYAFLQPNHSLHSLFLSFVEQYTKVLNLDQYTNLQTKLDQGIENKYTLLSNAKHRAEYQAQQEEKERKDLQQKEKEQREFASVDWNNFVVVQTIEFTNADYRNKLPVPLSLAQLQFASLEQKKMGVQMIEEAEPDFVPADDGDKPHMHPDDDDTSVPAAPVSQPQPQNGQPQPQPQPHKNIKIKQRGRRNRKQEDNTKYIAPGTNEAVPLSEFNNYMRVNQLDPKYREYKQVEESRKATSNLNESEAEQNLKRMHSAMYQNENEHEQGSSETKKKKREIGPSR